MIKQKERFKLSSLRLATATRTVFLALAITMVGVLAITNTGSASATQTTAQYCSEYTTNGTLNACKAGIRGQDCSDYAITYDQATADVCTKAAKAKANGEISDTPTATTSPSVTTSPGTNNSTDAEVYKNVILTACAPYKNDTAAALWCLYGGLGKDGKEGTPRTVQDCLNKPELQGSSANQGACITGATSGQTYLAQKNGDAGTNSPSASSSSNPFSIQDLLDQTKTLSSFIDILHATGKDSKVDTSTQPDNTYGSYINGAGKPQAIKVYPSGQPNAPAILFFNGGGWHSNDGDSDKIAPYAIQRGYTAFDVTYRLGSDGVYYMFEDVMRGVEHIRNNAALYGIDPNKMVVWGDSSGGSLASRVGSSGKSGAKVMVGWSPPVNAYTAIFHSFQAFGIGVDHSTCIPTDLAGFANLTDLLTGGNGDVAEEGQGLSSNDFSSLGISQGPTGLAFDMNSVGGGNPLSLLTDVLTAGQYAATTGQNIESISQQIETAYNNGSPSLDSIMSSGLPSNLLNLSAKKLVECIDNFNVLSPALFASPDSPPGFFAGFDNDGVVAPDQPDQMRDKLLSLGIKSESLVLPGDPGDASTAAPAGAGGNHLGYDFRFVCPTLNFVDSVIQPEKGNTDCTSMVPGLEGTIQPIVGVGNGGAPSTGSGSISQLSDVFGQLGNISSFTDLLGLGSNALGGLNNMFGGFGGLFGSGGGTGTGTGTGGNTNTGGTGTPAPLNIPSRSGSSGDWSGSRGGGTFTESKRGSECTIDYSRLKDLKTPAEKILSLCDENISKIQQKTSSLYHYPPVQIMVVPDNYTDNIENRKVCLPASEGGVGDYGAAMFALVSVGRIMVCGDWLKTSAGNEGIIVHELGHLTQKYANSAKTDAHAPKWIIEAIPDYVAAKLGYHPTYQKPLVCTNSAYRKYTSGYQCGAAFFDYIATKYNQPNLVQKVHAAANKGSYSDSVITAGTGKSLDELWGDCLKENCKGGEALETTARVQVAGSNVHIGEKDDWTGSRGGAGFVEWKRTGNCTVDSSRVKDAAQIAYKYVDACGAALPKITGVTSDTFQYPPIQIMIVPKGFTDKYASATFCDNGVAFAIPEAGRIYACAGYVLDHPNDIGMIVHEATHTTQHYNGKAPGWVAESIADYVRVTLGYQTGNTYACRDTETYQNGYGCGAVFFKYLVRVVDSNIVKKVHTAANNWSFTSSTITSGTGKTLDQLYQSCLQAECKGGKAL